MQKNNLIAALEKLKVQTGSLACLGCGHEQNCTTKGCAILRATLEVVKNTSDIKPGDSVYEIFIDEIEGPYINQYTVQDVSLKSIRYSDEWFSIEGIGEYIFLSQETAQNKRDRLLKELNKEGVQNETN